MRHLFISDLHLGDHNPNLEQLFHAFMEHLPKKSDALYILGDFFEAWIGDDVANTLSESVIQAMHKFTESGGQGFIMHGNRDFLLGNDFAKQTGFRLISEPYSLKLNNKACCLLHGDSLCTDDVDYQEFKKMVRNPEWQSEFLSKSLEERLAIARALREKSQESMQQKSDDIVDANHQAIESLFNESKADIIIHGHTHRQKRHSYEFAKQVERIVLGDWGETGCVLIVDDSGFHLKNFNLSDLHLLSNK